jgi:hypothetical protein
MLSTASCTASTSNIPQRRFQLLNAVGGFAHHANHLVDVAFASAQPPHKIVGHIIPLTLCR